MSTVKVTDSSFSDSVLNSDKPVLVDFWAEWCGPCKAIAPALEEMAQSMGDRVTVAKINIDENPQIPQQYGVRGIPTLMLFKEGQVAATKMGAMPKAQLQQWIDEALCRAAFVPGRFCSSRRTVRFSSGHQRRRNCRPALPVCSVQRRQSAG